MEIKEKAELKQAWLKSGKEDIILANDLFRLKHYGYCLFFCHLAIEKLLKALYIKTIDSYPPPTHKLAKLAKDARVVLTDEQIAHLNEITTFNIEARYDVIKTALYRKATSDFAKKYLRISTDLFNYFVSLI